MESIESVISAPSITNYHSDGPPIFNQRGVSPPCSPCTLQEQRVYTNPILNDLTRLTHAGYLSDPRAVVHDTSLFWLLSKTKIEYTAA